MGPKARRCWICNKDEDPATWRYLRICPSCQQAAHYHCAYFPYPLLGDLEDVCIYCREGEL